jgi:hypothetical protein
MIERFRESGEASDSPASGLLRCHSAKPRHLTVCSAAIGALVSLYYQRVAFAITALCRPSARPSRGWLSAAAIRYTSVPISDLLRAKAAPRARYRRGAWFAIAGST